MGHTISEWIRCPECGDGGTDISVFTYKRDIVLECRSCSETAEFTIGEDVPFNSLDTEAVSEEGDTQTG